MNATKNLRFSMIALVAGSLAFSFLAQAENSCLSYLSESPKTSPQTLTEKEFEHAWQIYALVNPKDSLSLQNKDLIWQAIEIEIQNQLPALQSHFGLSNSEAEQLVNKVQLKLSESMEVFRNRIYYQWETSKLDVKNNNITAEEHKHIIQVLNQEIKSKANYEHINQSVRLTFLHTINN